VSDEQHIPILFADESVLVVAKPPGVTVVPAPDAAKDACLKALVERQTGFRLWVVHRLDRDVSGAVALARTAERHRELSMAFEHREVSKTYLAFTAGIPAPAHGRIDIPLHAARKGKARPAAADEAGALPAATGYAVRTSWERDGLRVALVEAHPETGRHHQIRVHFRAIGTPLLFDATYGRAIDLAAFEESPCQRVALHASRLVLPGAAGAPLTVDAPLPPDLGGLLRWLDGTWDREDRDESRPETERATAEAVAPDAGA
jgi:tRNA pseudouridine32 synthase / 23S rRNA pseudouridine746 synthase